MISGIELTAYQKKLLLEAGWDPNKWFFDSENAYEIALINKAAGIRTIFKKSE
ncbi:hypothetical protein [Paenibacillus sp. SI8]|uniref:DUF6906 family protein n=1 Tax=unclassified Paenibacillus TaxID=185978 RepID=UPI0034659CE6